MSLEVDSSPGGQERLPPANTLVLVLGDPGQRDQKITKHVVTFHGNNRKPASMN